MVEDPKWELALLATVQSFYQRLLSDQLGGELPAPAELAPDVISHADDVRSTLGSNAALDPAARHGDHSRHAATWSCNPILIPRWRKRCCATSRAIATIPAPIATRPIWSQLFCFAIRAWLDSGSSAATASMDRFLCLRLKLRCWKFCLSPMCPCSRKSDVQLLREFGPLLDQANRFQDFSALMDSGIIPRVRELKASLGESIYHPGVLATLAPYNAAFGDRFHTLFAAAAQEIKDFANRLEELGGSILSTVDGVEVTVEHVAALNQEALLKIDYSAALEKFRRVSELKKELERRPPIRRAHPDSRPPRTCSGRWRRGCRSGARSASMFPPRSHRRRYRSKKRSCGEWKNRSAFSCASPIPSSARSCPCVIST